MKDLDIATKDSLNAVNILNKVYESTQDNKVREDEILIWMDKLNSCGYDNIANVLSGMHVKQGASDRFSTIATIDTTVSALETTKVDTSTISPTMSKTAGVSGDVDIDTKRTTLYQDLKSELSQEVDKYNQFK